MWTIALSWITLEVYLIYCTDVHQAKVLPRSQSCLDYLRSGSHINGIYFVTAPSGTNIPVYCDFNSEPGSAWTLVMSWSLENNIAPAFKSHPLTQNAPVQSYRPNWIAYRVSKNVMTSVKSQSTHWRATCSFEKVTFDYRDYVRGSFKDFDITTYQGAGDCKKVEFINIRGIAGSHVTVPFWQLEHTYMLHTDSSHGGCQFNARAGAVSGEDNFGFYSTTNKMFRCTSDQSATTQYWFGGRK